MTSSASPISRLYLAYISPTSRLSLAWICAMTSSMFCLVCGEQRYLGFHCASGLACRRFFAGFFRACASLPPCACWAFPCLG